MFDEAVSISHPANLMSKYIPDKQPSGKTVIIGMEKLLLKWLELLK